MRRNHGFTLLEVLFAAALTALLATAGWAWIRGTVRAGTRMQQHLDLLVEATAVVRLMNDDLRGAQTSGGPALIADRGFRCRTLAIVPQQPGPGWRDVTWDCSPSGVLVRHDGETMRTISTSLHCTWRVDEHAPPRWWVTMTPGTATVSELASASQASKPVATPVVASWVFALAAP